MNTSEWFLKYWYLLLFPAFVCAAGTQWTTTLPSAPTGFIFAYGLIYFAVKMERGSLDNTPVYARLFFFVLFPLFIIYIMYKSSYDVNPYDLWAPISYRADINNPWLDDTQNFWRAMISGIGAILATIGALGATKLFSSEKFKQIFTMDPKPIDAATIFLDDDDQVKSDKDEQI